MAHGGVASYCWPSSSNRAYLSTLMVGILAIASQVSGLGRFWW